MRRTNTRGEVSTELWSVVTLNGLKLERSSFLSVMKESHPDASSNLGLGPCPGPATKYIETREDVHPISFCIHKVNCVHLHQ